MNILDEIFADKKIEVAARKQKCPQAEVCRAAEESSLPLEFLATIRKARNIPALIAEVKFASPSKGVLVIKPEPVRLARLYTENGASAISILTDEKYFHGHLNYMIRIHNAFPQMPLLCKDFICDPYQVYEARASGASAILLIAACLSQSLLADLHGLALSLGLAPLVEVHNRIELEAALRLDNLRLLGVNNRDLHTFKVNLQTCLDLRPLVPAGVCYMAESGIHTFEDVHRLSAAGVDAMLVGEALVVASDIGAKIQSLISTSQEA